MLKFFDELSLGDQKPWSDWWGTKFYAAPSISPGVGEDISYPSFKVGNKTFLDSHVGEYIVNSFGPIEPKAGMFNSSLEGSCPA